MSASQQEKDMFKIFPGFHLIDKYHSAKKEAQKHLGKRFRSIFILTIIVLITAFLWNIPGESYGIEGLTVVQQRVIAIFVFAALMWLFEVIPSWATSVALITLLLLFASDSSFIGARTYTGGQPLGELLSSADIIASFADPIVMLFIGGFILAIATSKCGLDVYLARTLIKPFGRRSDMVLLGFVLITGTFSMFISNTATAAMMLTFLAPVFKALPPDGKGRVALTLSIPVAANIGGMGTPIGTPPNAFALKYLNSPTGLNLNIGFGEWMAMMMPLTIVLLIVSWFLLKKFFPFTQKEIDLEIAGTVKRGMKSYIVYATFIVTVLLWIFDKYTGINANVVAMIPIAVFSVTGVIDKHDLEEINWSVIWMVAGGFALGMSINDSGLAERVVSTIPFGSLSPVVLLIVSGLICYTLSNFISNTATAALLIPILVVVGAGMGDKLDGIGGMPTLLIGIAVAASAAMVLPISTPPNALAHSTGLVKQSEMMKIGIIVGLITITAGYTLLYFVGSSHLLL